MEETTWATVTETNGITVAEMLVKRLEAAEIPAQAVQESAGRAFGFMSGPLGTAYVRVPTKYLEEARLLLDVDEADESDIVTCPECGSKKIERQLSVFAARDGGSSRPAPVGPCGNCDQAGGGCPYQG